MKRLWIFNLLFLLLVGCSSPKFYVSPTREYITTNIDSICQIDLLPINTNDWIPNYLKDYESGKGFVQYLYIKDSIIYVRTDSTIIKRQ